MFGRYSHLPDHSTGLVRYTGSSTLPEYSRFLPSSLRRKRSVSFFCVLLGTAVERPLECSLKLVVSTTSVLPSQRPTEWPCSDVWLAGGCARPSRYTVRSASIQSTFMRSEEHTSELQSPYG